MKVFYLLGLKPYKQLVQALGLDVQKMKVPLRLIGNHSW